MTNDCVHEQDVAHGRVCLGKIHVAAATPLMLDCKTSSDYMDLASSIQSKQQQLIYCSEYHVGATAKLLDMDPAVVRSGMRKIGCNFWPDLQVPASVPALPDDPSELCSLMLHFGHNLARLCPGKQGSCWCTWANPPFPFSCSENNFASVAQDPATLELSRSLTSLFDEADAARLSGEIR